MFITENIIRRARYLYRGDTDGSGELASRFFTIGDVSPDMSAPDPVTMDDAERDVFLGVGGVGVLSMVHENGADDPPHSVPVSYGYDEREETFYR